MEQETKMQYSEFSKERIIENWPYGSKRVQCNFSVEHKDNKERAVRVTKKPSGIGWNKPKKMTYAREVLFATGDDDKTYVLSLTDNYAISIMQSNMKYQHEYIHSDDARFDDIVAKFGVTHAN